MRLPTVMCSKTQSSPFIGTPRTRTGAGGVLRVVAPPGATTAPPGKVADAAEGNDV